MTAPTTSQSERHAPPTPETRGSTQRRWTRRLAGASVSFVVLFFAGLVFLASLPDVNDAESRVDAILATHHSHDSGQPVPEKLGRAIVAVEDARFYEHHGIDVQGVTRALWGTLTRRPGDQGGATITQQLAKVLYGTGDGWTVKAAQVGLALKFEARYNKAQILEMYLNAVYFGDGQWGADAACATYFHKTCNRLDWAEASLLAGLPQAPSSYDPTRHFTTARARQRHVLDRLVADGQLNHHQADTAYDELTTLAR